MPRVLRGAHRGDLEGAGGHGVHKLADHPGDGQEGVVGPTKYPEGEEGQTGESAVHEEVGAVAGEGVQLSLQVRPLQQAIHHESAQGPPLQQGQVLHRLQRTGQVQACR